MEDSFSARADNVSAPATRGVAVTPHDGKALADLPKALFVGTGGHVVVAGGDGVDVTFRNVPNGSVLPFRARYVRATGTTAGDVLALY